MANTGLDKDGWTKELVTLHSKYGPAYKFLVHPERQVYTLVVEDEIESFGGYYAPKEGQTYMVGDEVFIVKGQRPFVDDYEDEDEDDDDEEVESDGKGHASDEESKRKQDAKRKKDLIREIRDWDVAISREKTQLEVVEKLASVSSMMRPMADRDLTNAVPGTISPEAFEEMMKDLGKVSKK